MFGIPMGVKLGSGVEAYQVVRDNLVPVTIGNFAAAVRRTPLSGPDLTHKNKANGVFVICTKSAMWRACMRAPRLHESRALHEICLANLAPVTITVGNRCMRPWCVGCTTPGHCCAVNPGPGCLCLWYAHRHWAAP